MLLCGACIPILESFCRRQSSGAASLGCTVAGSCVCVYSRCETSNPVNTKLGGSFFPSEPLAHEDIVLTLSEETD